MNNNPVSTAICGLNQSVRLCYYKADKNDLLRWRPKHSECEPCDFYITTPNNILIVTMHVDKSGANFSFFAFLKILSNESKRYHFAKPDKRFKIKDLSA